MSGDYNYVLVCFCYKSIPYVVTRDVCPSVRQYIACGNIVERVSPNLLRRLISISV